MNIFEQLDKLVKKAELVNESKKYEDLPIDPSMETEEQGREYIRDYFRKELMKPDDGGGGGGDSDEPRIMPIDPTPPPPPFHIKRPPKGPDGKDDDKLWKTAEVEWDDDEFLRRLEIEADELEKTEDIDPEEFGEEYDDFTEGPETKGPGSGGGDDDMGLDDDDDKKPSPDDGGGDGFGGGSSEKDPFKKPDDDDEYEEKTGGGKGDDGEEGEGDADDDKTDGEGDGKSKDGKDKKDKPITDPGGGGGGDTDDGDEGEDGEGGDYDKPITDPGGGKSGKDKKRKDDEKSGRGGGTDDIDEEGEGGDDDKEGEGGGKKGDDGDDEKEGKGGGKDGDDDDKGKSASEELEDTIKDALEKLAEANEDEKEELKELLDMLDDEGVTEKDIDKKEGEFDDMKEHGKEKLDKLKSLVGRLERMPTKEEIEKEIEASKLSDEEKDALKDMTVESATMPPPPKDSELETLKKEAMKELDRKCKGKSKLAMSVLYHSLKTPKIDKSDWDIILDKVLANKSKHSNIRMSKSTTKKVILGDKNHMWRDVRYGYKKVKKGEDKKKIYCFIDYSGSVKSEPGLIMTFLGKVLELTERLEYTDLTVYTFADALSVPRVISKEMVETEGYEEVLTDTINFFDLRENNVGGSIEDFSLVAYEINKIKRDDKEAVFFIFGDGVWTFYGNSHPPTRLKEICAAYVKDIIPFIFYYDEDDFRWKSLGKEIALLKDVVGIDDVIVTKASRMKE